MEIKKQIQITLKQYENLVINAFKSTGFLLINKQLINQYGLTGAGILSNYIDRHLYFAQTKPDSDGWFYLTFEKQKADLGLDKYTLKLWKDTFIKQGILKTRSFGMPAKMYFKIDFTKFVIEDSTVLVRDAEESTEVRKQGVCDNFTDLPKTGGLEMETQIPDTKLVRRDKSQQSQQNQDIQKTGGLYITISKSKISKSITPVSEGMNEFFPQSQENNDKKQNTQTLRVKSKNKISNKEEADLITVSQFDDFWKRYPKKVNKGDAFKLWFDLCTNKKKAKTRPSWTQVRKAIHDHKKSERWQNEQFIPYPATWIEKFMWLTDHNDLKTFKPFTTQKEKPQKIYDRGQYWFWNEKLQGYFDKTGEEYEKH